MKNKEIRSFLQKINREDILSAFRELDTDLPSKQSLIKQFVIRHEDNSYPPAETIRIAYKIANNQNLLNDFFQNIGENSEHFRFIRENGFELNRVEGRKKKYLKRVLENELGYRNGIPTAGETLLISKEAAYNFFPPLGVLEKNDNRKLHLSSKTDGVFHSVTYTYHNDKFFGGTRNEFRIYLTSDFLNNFRKFEPNDLVLIAQIANNGDSFVVNHIKAGDDEYDMYDSILGTQNHYMADNINELQAPAILYKTKKPPINQILFGPPGTGKTYSTITKALTIIGLLKEKDSYTNEEYGKAQKLFENELGKRIEFVTMHQSFSYEDFVQGLKPIKSADGNGITFDYKNGVFKEICERADFSKILYQRSTNEEIVITDKLFPSFFLSIDEQSVYEILSQKIFDGEKITQKKAFEYFNNKLGKKYCKAWRDKFDYVLGENSPRTGYQPDKFREGELEDFKEYAKKFMDLTPENRNEKLINEWIEDKPKSDIVENELHNHVIILDEINRANISRVFGELIALIEEDKRDGKLTATLPSGERFTVPSNLYIIGTMNTADKSIALVDIALRRRFEFIPLYPNKDLLKSVLIERKFNLDEINLRLNLMINLNKIIRAKKSVDFEIGHSYFMENGTLINILNNKVIPLLNEYFMYNLRKVKEIIEKQQKDLEGSAIPKLGIVLNQKVWAERGLLEVESIDLVKGQKEDKIDIVDDPDENTLNS